MNNPINIYHLTPIVMTCFTDDVTASVCRLSGFHGGFGGGFGRSFYYIRYLRGGGDWTWFMIGGYAILGFFLVLIVRYCIRMYSVHKKEDQTTQTLEQICETDSFWHVENMKSWRLICFIKCR